MALLRPAPLAVPLQPVLLHHLEPEVIAVVVAVLEDVHPRADQIDVALVEGFAVDGDGVLLALKVVYPAVVQVEVPTPPLPAAQRPGSVGSSSS